VSGLASPRIVVTGRAALAIKSRLPMMHYGTEAVEAGVLMAFGVDITHLFRRAATYVDKVESEVDRGSTFTFTLAVTPHAEKLVLIVDDNERNRKLLRDVLQVQGYRTLDAETAEDGIRLAQQSRPGLVLMDIQLPGMDGVAALGALRADPRTRDIPVIAVTASVMPPDRGRIMAAGFDGYLAKPIDVKAFLEVVRETLGRRRGGGAAPAPSAADAGGMPAGTA
jgi:two-component system cell cycle response regulator DivK